jgi:SPP1 gp7 family putative phage head morphogenesis protein
MLKTDAQIKLDLFFEKYKYASMDQFDVAIKKLFDSLISEIIRIDPSSYNRLRLNKMLKDIATQQSDLFNEAQLSMVAELSAASVVFLHSYANLLNQNPNFAIIDQVYNPDNDKILGYTFEELFQSASERTTKNIKASIINNLLQGNNPKSFSNEIFKQQVTNSKNQILTATRTYAKQIRESIKDEMDSNTSGVLGWISLATLDSRTSPICIKYNGRVYPKTEFKSRSDIPNKPPRHFNCRSSLVLYYGDSTTGTRASNGDNGGAQIQADTTFDEFLKRNNNTAEKLLGPARYNLYKTGKYNINDFINDEGVFFTLDQLKKEFT